MSRRSLSDSLWWNGTEAMGSLEFVLGWEASSTALDVCLRFR